VKEYINTVYSTLKPYHFPEFVALYLVSNYGTQTEWIIREFAQLQQKEQGSPEMLLLKAELHFSLNHEMIVSLEDFFVRRTGLLYFDIDKVVRTRQEIGNELKRLLAWTDTTLAAEMNSLDNLIQQVTEFNND
jgi:glycerol-3-phosphate dehydrogenase